MLIAFFSSACALLMVIEFRLDKAVQTSSYLDRSARVDGKTLKRAIGALGGQHSPTIGVNSMFLPMYIRGHRRGILMACTLLLA